MKELAEKHKANHAINVVYYDEIHITHIDDWRICPARWEDTCDGPPQYLPEQKQYQTHYGSMIIEKWALSIFEKVGFHCKAARTDKHEDAHCQICNYHHGYEFAGSETPYLDMYVCDVCERTYHWKCMRELGCYNDEQRQEVDANEASACPACATLSDED